ncbi:hypothetical protein DL93DRAFT_1903609 [Clavulina sp. PMI_390]|nr:hypothetical protein DL93DRAFT_1903609 [Clavulina sp. PMI_390]
MVALTLVADLSPAFYRIFQGHVALPSYEAFDASDDTLARIARSRVPPPRIVSVLKYGIARLEGFRPEDAEEVYSEGGGDDPLSNETRLELQYGAPGTTRDTPFLVIINPNAQRDLGTGQSVTSVTWSRRRRHGSRIDTYAASQGANTDALVRNWRRAVNGAVEDAAETTLAVTVNPSLPLPLPPPPPLPVVAALPPPPVVDAPPLPITATAIPPLLSHAEAPPLSPISTAATPPPLISAPAPAQKVWEDGEVEEPVASSGKVASTVQPPYGWRKAVTNGGCQTLALATDPRGWWSILTRGPQLPSKMRRDDTILDSGTVLKAGTPIYLDTSKWCKWYRSPEYLKNNGTEPPESIIVVQTGELSSK